MRVQAPQNDRPVYGMPREGFHAVSIIEWSVTEDEDRTTVRAVFSTGSHQFRATFWFGPTRSGHDTRQFVLPMWYKAANVPVLKRDGFLIADDSAMIGKTVTVFIYKAINQNGGPVSRVHNTPVVVDNERYLETFMKYFRNRLHPESAYASNTEQLANAESEISAQTNDEAENLRFVEDSGF